MYLSLTPLLEREGEKIDAYFKILMKNVLYFELFIMEIISEM